MTDRREAYGGDELFDIFDKAGEQGEDPNLRNAHVGNQIKRSLSKHLPSNEGLDNDGGQGQRQLGTDVQDPYGSAVKPKGVPTWTKVPETDSEKSLYYGDHIHDQSNPLGLHTHVPGGSMGGGHTHGPDNPHGQHFHGEEIPQYGGRTLDGRHIHEVGKNMPCGSHEHMPGNFG